MAQSLFSSQLPLVLCNETLHSSKTSRSLCVNRGDTVSLGFGSSDRIQVRQLFQNMSTKISSGYFSRQSCNLWSTSCIGVLFCMINVSGEEELFALSEELGGVFQMCCWNRSSSTISLHYIYIYMGALSRATNALYRLWDYIL